jgi:hypothetical protein
MSPKLAAFVASVYHGAVPDKTRDNPLITEDQREDSELCPFWPGLKTRKSAQPGDTLVIDELGWFFGCTDGRGNPACKTWFLANTKKTTPRVAKLRNFRYTQHGGGNKGLITKGEELSLVGMCLKDCRFLKVPVGASGAWCGAGVLCMVPPTPTHSSSRVLPLAAACFS